MINNDRIKRLEQLLILLTIKRINNKSHQNTLNKSSFKNTLEESTHIICNIKRKYK